MRNIARAAAIKKYGLRRHLKNTVWSAVAAAAADDVCVYKQLLYVFFSLTVL